MTDSQTKSSNGNEELEVALLKQAQELLEIGKKDDLMFRDLLKKNWKDKKLVGEINDSIQFNNQTMKALQDEIKDRNSKLNKK